MRVVFSARAEADLEEIGDYIARGNPARARSFVMEIRTAAVGLRDMPRAFLLMPRHEHYGLRRRPFRNYLIFYRVDDAQISIAHIIHGARDYEKLLFSETRSLE